MPSSEKIIIAENGNVEQQIIKCTEQDKIVYT